MNTEIKLTLKFKEDQFTTIVELTKEDIDFAFKMGEIRRYQDKYNVKPKEMDEVDVAALALRAKLLYDFKSMMSSLVHITADREIEPINRVPGEVFYYTIWADGEFFISGNLTWPI